MSEEQPTADDVIDSDLTEDEQREIEHEATNGEQQRVVVQPPARPGPIVGGTIHERLEVRSEVPVGSRSSLTGRDYGYRPTLSTSTIPRPGVQAAKEFLKRVLNEEKEALRHSNWRIRVRRESPFQDPSGRRLETTEDLVEVGLINPEDLQRQIRDAYGGGAYRATIYNDAGIHDRMWRFDFSVASYPPRNGSVSPVGKDGAPVLEDDEMRQLERDKRKWAFDRERAKAEEEDVYQRAVRAKELRSERETETVSALRKEMDERERRRDEENRRRDEQFTRMIEKQNDIIQSIANRPVDTGMKEMMGGMMAAMTSMTGNIITAIAGKKDDGGSLAAIMDANKSVAAMAAENAKAMASSQTESLKQVIGILGKQGDSSKQIKDYLEFSDRAEEKAFRFVEMLQGRLGDGGGGDDFIHDDGSINWGGAIKGVVGALKEMRGAGGEAGRVAQEAIGNANDTQLRGLAEKLVPYLSQAVNRARGQQLAAASTPALPLPEGGIVEVETDSSQPAQPMTGQWEQPVPVDGDPNDNPAARRREAVTELVRQWIRDGEDGVVEPRWVEFGVEALGNFLDELVARPNVAERIALVSQHCDPAVFGRWQAMAMDMNSPGYQRTRTAWTKGLAAMIELFRQRGA